MIHELKIFTTYFDAVRNGAKTFELRKNDRGFKVGDFLALNEWDGESYTGSTELVKVTYILSPNDFMVCRGGYAVMSIAKCGVYDSPREDDNG